MNDKRKQNFPIYDKTFPYMVKQESLQSPNDEKSEFAH